MEELNNLRYLNSIVRQFKYYKLIAEKAIDQLDPAQLSFQLNESSNSIPVIIKHLSGNMLSRWTDFKTTDGEKPWRNRDQEFVDDISNKEELMNIWEKGWSCLFTAIDSIDDNRLNDIIYIRNEGHTILEAINRQLAHYSYHIGQIVFLAKYLKDNNWETLSIPKNKSLDYNNLKFDKEKTEVHFTEAELKRLNGRIEKDKEK